MFKVLSYKNTLTDDATSNNFVELLENKEYFVSNSFNKTIEGLYSNIEETYDFLRNFANLDRNGVIEADLDENYLVSSSCFYTYNSELYLKVPTGIAISGNTILVNRPDFNSLRRQLSNKTLTYLDLEEYEFRTDLPTGKLWARVSVQTNEENRYIYFGTTDVEWDNNTIPGTAYTHPLQMLEAIATSLDEKLLNKIPDASLFTCYPTFKLVEGDYVLAIGNGTIQIRNLSDARLSEEVPLARITVASDLTFTIVDYRDFMAKKPVSPSEQFIEAYWSMEDLPAEPDGDFGYYATKLFDNTNNGNDGIIYNCRPIKGPEGKALNFGIPISLVESNVTIDNGPSLNTGGTILAIIKPHTSQLQTEAFIIDKYSSSNDYNIKLNGNILEASVGTTTVSHPITLGETYSIAFTFDSSWAKLYINNKLVDKKENAQLPSASVGTVVIGNSSFGGTFNKTFSGFIDEVKMFAVVLTASEIEGLNTFKSSGKSPIGSITNYLLNNDITFGKDVVIQGDLTVSGTTTTVNTQNLTVADSVITINKNQIGTPDAGLISGIEVERGDEPNYNFWFRESDNLFVIGETGSEQAVATRADTPNNKGIAFWDTTASRFDTDADLTFNADTLKINTSIASTNTTSGSLVVGGGVGIGGAVNIGSDSFINGMRIGTGGLSDTNTIVGKEAFNITSTGANNTAIGYQVLLSNSTGASNTAIGYSALNANTIGAYNTAIGTSALRNNISGSHNIAIGIGVLRANTSGAQNTAIGNEALYTNTAGVDNIAIGNHALFFNSTGGNNTAIGKMALYTNSVGVNNIAIGNMAGQYETGSNKLFIDNADRSSEALGRVNSFIYGDMANKTLLLNATVTTDILVLRDETVATTTLGALRVAGGVDIKKNLLVESTTASSAYDNGAVVLSGGLGVAGAINTNSTVSVGGSLTVNGSALNTPTTFTIAGTATDLTIGATTGTTTIRNALSVGSISIGGAQGASISDAIKYALVLG